MEDKETKQRYQKCRGTGKVSFPTKTDARMTLLMFKWRYAINKLHQINGVRRKHRQGKPAQTRAYYCPHCNGYHLTKWTKYTFNRYIDSQEKEI